MSRTEQVEHQISALDPAESRAFRQWFAEYKATAWDKQIEIDATSEALDRISQRALEDLKAGRSTKL